MKKAFYRMLSDLMMLTLGLLVLLGIIHLVSML